MKRLTASFLLGFVLVTFSTIDTNAASTCGKIPQDYRNLEYGPVLYSLLKPCSRTFSHKEQVFVAGLSQGLLEKCGYPSNPNSRLKLQKFLSSSIFVGIIGRQYGNPNLGKGLEDQAASQAAYVTGISTAKSIGCTALGKNTANGIVKYLDRTSSDGDVSNNYVNGCTKYYSGRYTKAQCQCIADIGRSVFPNIHAQAFSPRSIKSIINSNPFVGMQIGFQCGIGNY